METETSPETDPPTRAPSGGLARGDDAYIPGLPPPPRTDNSPCLLLGLPPEVSSSLILGQFCDGRSLSTLLVALIASDKYRRFAIDGVAAAARSRVKDLVERGEAPSQGRWASSRWAHMDFAGEVSVACDAVGEAARAGGGRFLRELRTTVRRLSEALAALSFFEDDCGLRLDVIRDDYGGGGDAQGGRAEWPLWCGMLSMEAGDIASGTTEIRTARVVATTPSSTWHHVLLNEWTKFDPRRDDGATPRHLPLAPRPRNATPLPPLARLTGVSEGDRRAASAMARRLRLTDEVGHPTVGGTLPVGYLRKGSRIPMSVLVMTRRQALARLTSATGHLRRPRHSWPLECKLVSRGDGETRQHLQVVLEDAERRSDAVEDSPLEEDESDDELFAFMDGPYIGFDTEDEEVELGFATIVDDMVDLMEACRRCSGIASRCTSHGIITTPKYAAAKQSGIEMKDKME